MQGAFFTYALLGALATGLVVAAYTDLRRRQIDNWLTAAIAVSAPLYWLVAGLSWQEIAIQFALGLAVFVITAGLFAMRQMGGGDVKLLTALALWIAPLAYLKLVMMMGLIGGAASIAGAAFNLQRRDGEAARDMFGIAAAVLWVALSAWVALAIMGGVAPVSTQAMAALTSVFSSPWMLAAALLGVSAIMLAGIIHVVKRQRTRLKIPYGVAISIAALWVLATQYLPVMIGSEAA